MECVLQSRSTSGENTPDSDRGFRRANPSLRRDNNILMYARNGNLKQLRDHIKKDTSAAFAKTENNESTLLIAAACGQLEIVKELISCIFRMRERKERTPYDLINREDHKGFTPLHRAVENNHYYCTKYLIANYASVFKRNKQNLTPLHTAAKHGHSRLVELLVTNGTDVNTLGGPQSYTPMHYAVEENKPEVIETLLKLQGTPCMKSKGGDMPIHLACKNQCVEAVRALLTNCRYGYVSPEILLSFEDEEKNLPVHLALYSGSPEIIKLCISYGVSDKASLKHIPVHVAASQGNLQTLEAFEALEAELFQRTIEAEDHFGLTPLHKAAISNQTKAITFFLDHGASINTKDKLERTPLLCAAEHGQWEAMKLLIKNGADPLIVDSNKKSILHHVTKYSAHIQEVATFKKFKLILNDRDGDGDSPLHKAVIAGNQEAVETLIKLDAQVTVKNNKHQSPFYCSVMHGMVAICKLLLVSKKPYVNEVDIDGVSVLHAACKHENEQIVSLLLNKQAKILRDVDMNTPLHYAAESGCIKCVKHFEKFPDLLDAVNTGKSTPLHVASTQGHTKIVIYLLDHDVHLTRNSNLETFIDIILKLEFEETGMAVINHRRWQEVLDLHSKYFHSVFLGILARMPRVAERVLQRCMHISFTKAQTDILVMHYDFKYLDLYHSKQNKTDVNIDENAEAAKKKFNSSLIFRPLKKMIDVQSMKCLEGPLTQKYIDLKWALYGKILYFVKILLYFIYMGSLTYVSTYITYSSEGVSVATGMKPDDRKTAILKVYPNLMTVLKNKMFNHDVFMPQIYFLLVQTVLFIIFQLKNFTQSVKEYGTLVPYFEWLQYATALVYLIPFVVDLPKEFGHYQWQCGAVTVFLAWFHVITILQGSKVIGLYAVMFLSLLDHQFMMMSVISVPLIAFGFVFYMVESSNEVGEYSTPLMSILKVCAMIMEVEGVMAFIRNAIDDKLFSMPFANTAIFFMLIFTLLVPILLMSMLGGLAVWLVNTMQRKARIKGVAMRVEFMNSMEILMPRFLREKCRISSFSEFIDKSNDLVESVEIIEIEDSESEQRTVRKNTLNNNDRINELHNHFENNTRMLETLIGSLHMTDVKKKDILQEMQSKL